MVLITQATIMKNFFLQINQLKRRALRMIVKIVVERVVDSDLGYIFKYLFQHQYKFLLLLQDSYTVLVNIVRNTQPYEYFPCIILLKVFRCIDS